MHSFEAAFPWKQSEIERERERELKGEGVKGLRDSLRVCVCVWDESGVI